MNLPYGYLIGLLVLVLPVVRLPRLPMWLGTSVFIVTIPGTQLPFLVAVAFLASTGLAVSEGDLSSPVTIVAAVLAAACVALSIGTNLRAMSVLRRAMGSTRVSSHLPWRTILLGPFRHRPRSVERIADVSYGPHGERNTLDIYRNRFRPPTNAPVLIHFHGGYYAYGRKDKQSLPMLHRLAEQGYLCISANYRLRPEATYEDHLIDAKRVVAWVREHGREWGADPDRIVLSGSSAGAHMSTSAAFTSGESAHQPGFETVDTSVSGVVILGGFYDAYFHRPETDPAALAGPDAPPFLIVHGDRDSVVPVSRARLFADRLRRISDQAVVYAELPGAQHGFDLFHSPRFEAVVNTVEVFVARAVSAEPYRPE